MIALINLARLLIILLIILPVSLVKREIAIYWFLKISGPTFIKLGQILSIRPDLVGKKVAEILSKFQDKVSPFSERKVKQILHKEFVDNFFEVFSSFEYGPTASASIAQVHKAKLLTGESVAVKILRPGIKKIINRDYKTLKLLASLVKIFSLFLSKFFLDLANLLQQTTKYEVDLIREGVNGIKLREDLKDLEGYYVPKIYLKQSTQNILIIEWIDGIKFSDKYAISHSKFNKKIIAKNLVLSYFNQVYINGFFHADMHPGNLFLMQNGDIGVIDFGIMGRINKKTRIAVAEILIGFLKRDYDKIAEIHVESGLVPKDTNLEELSFSCRRLGEIIVDADVKNISLAKLLESLIEITREYKMETRPELILLQKTLLLVEGVGVSLDPDLNIWDIARPWVIEWSKNNISFDAKIYESFKEIFVKFKKFLSN